VLQWCTKVIRPGRSFLERIRTFCKTKGRTGEGPHSIPDEVRADIGWWFRFAREWNGVSVIYDRTWQEADKLLLYTDACERGFGARFGNRWIEAKWTTAQYNRACNADPNDTSKKVRSMPFLELLDVVIAAATWGPLWAGKRIHFWSDYARRSPSTTLTTAVPRACKTGGGKEITRISTSSDEDADPTYTPPDEDEDDQTYTAPS
jgi:hypothetical protein